MKRILTAFSIFCLPICFTSCTVNWFGEQYYVPLWINVIWISALILAVFAIMLAIISSKYFVCPKCKERFKPKWYKCFSAVFVNRKSYKTEDYLLTCPKCKKKSIMSADYNQTDKK